MCLIAFAIEARADLPLIIASNRDEQWSRPTLPLQAWTLPSGKEVYSGRDLQAGGTWLGMAQDGRVAMLTNVRQSLSDLAPRSRGDLVTGWLDANVGWQDWLSGIDPMQYGGFNLVLGDLAQGQWAWLSNRLPAGSVLALDTELPEGWHGGRLGPGLYGLSNAALDTPWPKTRALKQALGAHIAANSPAADADILLDALLHMKPAAAAELPATGVTPELELLLSSAFVHAPQLGYGTRSSMVVHWHADGRLDAREWTHEPISQLLGTEEHGHWPIKNSRCRQLASNLVLAGRA